MKPQPSLAPPAVLALAALITIAVVLGGLALPLPAVGPQEPSPQPPPVPATAAAAAEEAPAESAAGDQPLGVFEEAIEVKVVNVQVFVRDKDGNPVTGLTKDDFELYENKKQMPITNFYEVRERSRTDRPQEARQPSEGTTVIRSHPDFAISPVPEDERLHLIVYIDNFNIRPFSRNRVFRNIREFLRTHVTRDDRVMLVSYNRSLKYEREFTSDSLLISNALYSLEKHTGGRVQQDSEARQVLRDIDEARDPMQMEGRIRLYAESVFNDLQFTLDALKEMVMDLSGIPGRKAILYVSEGLPMRAGEEMFYAADQKIQQSGNDGAWSGASSNLLQALQYDASRRFQDLTNHANANEVVFYTIDAGGLRTSSMLSAENASFNTNFSTMVESVASQNLQSSIMFMADQTGGQFVINTNNVSDGLSRIATDFSHYYSLGYSPGHSGSGRAFNIEVKVNDKKLKVRHRESYRDKSIETEMADRTLAGLKFGYENNDLGIRLMQGEAIRRNDGNYVVHLEIRIPYGELVLIPQPDNSYVARVRMWVGAIDQKGGISQVQQSSVPIHPVPAEDLEIATKSYFVYQLPLVMRPGDQRIAVGVRDDMASRVSVVSRVISVGS